MVLTTTEFQSEFEDKWLFHISIKTEMQREVIYDFYWRQCDRYFNYYNGSLFIFISEGNVNFQRLVKINM